MALKPPPKIGEPGVNWGLGKLHPAVVLPPPWGGEKKGFGQPDLVGLGEGPDVAALTAATRQQAAKSRCLSPKRRGNASSRRLRDLGDDLLCRVAQIVRSEEHTSELQSLMRISYAVFCLNKKKEKYIIPHYRHQHLQ